MTSQWLSVLLRGVVVCLGMVSCLPSVGWAEDENEQAIEAARKTIRDSQNAKTRADLERRHKLELEMHDLKVQLQNDQIRLEDLRKKREALGPPEQPKPKEKAADNEEMPDFGGSEEPAKIAAVGAPSAQNLENAFVDRTVHVLLYGNTSDPLINGNRIGDGVAANQRFLTSLFQHQLGSRGRITPKTQFNVATIEQDIVNLSVKASDAVVVYISTHGAFLANGDHVMSRSGTADQDIRRSVVMERLRSKTSRNTQLRVLISDSCAVFSGSPPVWSKVEGEPYASQVLFRLLMTTTGEVSVNAAAPGKAAYYWNTIGDTGGGFFTRAFVYQSVYGRIPDKLSGTDRDWLTFFKGVSILAESTKSDKKHPPACYFQINGTPISF